MSNQNLNEILLDENIQLKTDLSIMRDENDYLQERNRNLQDELRISSLRHKEEIHKLQVQIAALESGEELADAYEYIEHQKAEIASLEEIIEEYRAKENFSDLQRIHFLELELEELRSRTAANPFHAGRKKNFALKEYIQKCLACGMEPKDIIGSEYIDKNGKKKEVPQSSFYRIWKELVKEGIVEKSWWCPIVKRGNIEYKKDCENIWLTAGNRNAGS